MEGGGGGGVGPRSARSSHASDLNIGSLTPEEFKTGAAMSVFDSIEGLCVCVCVFVGGREGGSYFVPSKCADLQGKPKHVAGHAIRSRKARETRRDRNMALQAEQRHNVNSAGHTVTDGQKKKQTNKQTKKRGGRHCCFGQLPFR